MLIALLTLAEKSRSSSGTRKAVAFPIIRKVGKSGEIRQGAFGNAMPGITTDQYFSDKVFFLVEKWSALANTI